MDTKKSGKHKKMTYTLLVVGLVRNKIILRKRFHRFGVCRNLLQFFLSELTHQVTVLSYT